MTTSACLSLSLILISTGNTPSKNQEYPPEAQYVLNEVLVKFNSDISKNLIQDAVASVQGRILTYLGEDISVIQWDPGVSALRSFLEDPDLFYLRVPEYIGTERAISILKQNPNVIHAEKNGIWHACREPNETNFNKLWGLNNTGLYDGTTDADIDAPEAWDIFTGSSSIVVAVIDTGVDYNHEDLAANIWINSDETPGDGDDDDSNGYIDDIRGWDFVNNDNNPMDDSNPVYHGTHVAGTIGAMGNNGKGVVGVNWNVKIMPLKALHSDGSGPWSSIISAIDYSWKNGAHISNNSYGGYIKPEDEGYFVSEAIWRARTAGKLFVAAAGNYGWNIDESNCHLYPAFYTQDNIIAVAATSNTDGLPDYSNWGPTSVDLGAPGGSDSTQNPYNILHSARKNHDFAELISSLSSLISAG